MLKAEHMHLSISQRVSMSYSTDVSDSEVKE